MTLLHLHLITNHLPVLGPAFALGLLGFGLWRKSTEVTKAALGALVICSLLALPAYFTGEPAEDAMKRMSGISKSAIEEHQEAATAALIGIAVTGVVSLAGLLAFRHGKPVPAWLGSIILVAVLAVCGLMGWTAMLGGQIRHTEIRTGNWSIFREQ